MTPRKNTKTPVIVADETIHHIPESVLVNPVLLAQYCIQAGIMAQMMWLVWGRKWLGGILGHVAESLPFDFAQRAKDFALYYATEYVNPLNEGNYEPKDVYLARIALERKQAKVESAKPVKAHKPIKASANKAKVSTAQDSPESAKKAIVAQIKPMPHTQLGAKIAAYFKGNTPMGYLEDTYKLFPQDVTLVVEMFKSRKQEHDSMARMITASDNALSIMRASKARKGNVVKAITNEYVSRAMWRDIDISLPNVESPKDSPVPMASVSAESTSLVELQAQLTALQNKIIARLG